MSEPAFIILDETAAFQRGGDDDDLTHTYCCNPDRALCGADLTGTPEVADWDDADECLVCLDLEPQPCTCGEQA